MRHFWETRRDCTRAVGYTSWFLRAASQIQMTDNRKILFGLILCLSDPH